MRLIVSGAFSLEKCGNIGSIGLIKSTITFRSYKII